MLPQWKMSISDKWPSGTACETPFRISGQCWFLNLSHTIFYSRFASSTFKLARNMKLPPLLPITAPVVIAGNNMVKSAHPSFPRTSQVTVLKGKHNHVSHRASSLFPPSVPENVFLEYRAGGGGLSPPSPIYSVSCSKWLILQVKTVFPSQTTGCNSSPRLFEKKKGRHSWKGSLAAGSKQKFPNVHTAGSVISKDWG